MKSNNEGAKHQHNYAYHIQPKPTLSTKLHPACVWPERSILQCRADQRATVALVSVDN